MSTLDIFPDCTDSVHDYGWKLWLILLLIGQSYITSQQTLKIETNQKGVTEISFHVSDKPRQREMISFLSCQLHCSFWVYCTYVENHWDCAISVLAYLVTVQTKRTPQVPSVKYISIDLRLLQKCEKLISIKYWTPSGFRGHSNATHLMCVSCNVTLIMQYDLTDDLTFYWFGFYYNLLQFILYKM